MTILTIDAIKEQNKKNQKTTSPSLCSNSICTQKHLFSSRMLLPSRRGFSGVAQASVGCDASGCVLLLPLACVLARDMTESRDGDGRAELCRRVRASRVSMTNDRCRRRILSICTREAALQTCAGTCKDEGPDAPALLPLAFDDKLKLDDMPSKLGLGLAPCRLPGAAVPGADTALK